MTTNEAIERLKRLENSSYVRGGKTRAMGGHNVSREHAADAEALRLAIMALKLLTECQAELRRLREDISTL